MQVQKVQKVRTDSVHLVVQVTVAMDSREEATSGTQAEDLNQGSVREAESGAAAPSKFSLDFV